MNNTKEHKYKTVASIPIIAVLIPSIVIITIIIISLNTHVISYNKENLINTEEIISDNNIPEENIITVIMQDKQEDKDTNNQEEEINIQEQQEEKHYNAIKSKNYDVIATLNIPSLNINYPILSKTSSQLLKIALNKYWGANPNEAGNMVVVGHNYKDNKFFSRLPEIKKGAIVEITDTTGKTLKYTVYETSVVDQYDNSCTSQLTHGQTEITLITCYYDNGNPHATKRFVAKARV